MDVKVMDQIYLYQLILSLTNEGNKLSADNGVRNYYALCLQ
jgi:hypothetical protein